MLVAVALFTLGITHWLKVFPSGAVFRDAACCPYPEGFFREQELKFTRPPMVGPEVEEVQKRLQDLGFLVGEVDGVYGPRTVASVKRFQAESGLAPTGIVDRITLKKLGEGIVPQWKPPAKPPRGKLSIKIDINTRTLAVYADGQEYYTFPVAVGTPRTPTPVGNFRVTDKGKWRGQFGGYWLGFNVPWGKYGIHGTNHPWTIGEAASEGCLRMFNEHVATLYQWIKPGTPVEITGLPPGRILLKGDRGYDVAIVQQKLIEKGYLSGSADGYFGTATFNAVVRLQKANQLYPDGAIGRQVYELLEIEVDREQGQAAPFAADG
jgi:peptidoglycan hydrolase-like protein with peptidoglycan-binding domain